MEIPNHPITRIELARDCCHSFAYFLFTYENKPFRDLWMECHSPSEIEQLLGNKAINDFLRSQFQSESFNQRYRPLNDIQLIKVRNAFLKSGLYMKEFCWRLLEIFDAQKHLAENPSNLRISWNWPECEEYLEEFNEVKLELLKF